MQILKEEVRENILQAALDEIFVKGYEKASLQEIAKRCAISKSNVYNYFPSKKSIYDALTAPALMEIEKITRELTTRTCCPEEIDDVAREFTEALKHGIYQYRKEIAIIIRRSLEEKESDILKLLQKELVQCFMRLDASLLPRNFLEILSGMLIDGICKIVMQSGTKEETEEQLFALFRYHIRGIQAFKSEKKGGR